MEPVVKKSFFEGERTRVARAVVENITATNIADSEISAPGRGCARPKEVCQVRGKSVSKTTSG
jgi:hypothetical protein